MPIPDHLNSTIIQCKIKDSFPYNTGKFSQSSYDSQIIMEYATLFKKIFYEGLP